MTRRLLPFGLLLVLLQPRLLACSICSGGLATSTTLREKCQEAHAVIRGELKNARFDGQGGTTEFHFTKALKADAKLGQQKSLVINKYYPIVGNTSPDYLLFLDTRGEKPEILSGVPCDAAMATYLEGIQKLDPRKARDRLAYFFRHLESATTAIAEDAFLEFAKASDADLTASKEILESAKLRTWLADVRIAPERLGVYALLLGLSGNQEDVARLKGLLGERTKDGTALAGVLAGLTLLDAKTGWQQIQAIITDAQSNYARRLAAVTAVRFFQINRPEASQEVLQTTYRLMLTTELADVAITDLRRYGIKSLTAEILALYSQPNQSRLIKRLIVRYALTTDDDKARNFIVAIKKSDPQAVADAESYLREVEGRK